MNRSILVLASLFIGLVLSSPVLASEINAENIVKYVNKSRVDGGVKELVVSDELNKVAMAKVNDMVENEYFAHTSPKGLTPWYWFDLVGYNYKYAGENLAINFTTAEAQHTAWMKSPTHKKNIMNTNYEEIGVAVAAGEVNGVMGIISVQEFGTLASKNKTGGEEKNFAPVEDRKIPDDAKFAPAVLSVGNENNNSKGMNDGTPVSKNEKSESWFLKDGVGSNFWLVVLLLVVLPLVIIQIILVRKRLGVSLVETLAPMKESLMNENNLQTYRTMKFSPNHGSGNKTGRIKIIIN